MLFNTPMPEMDDPTQAGGVPQIGQMPVDQPPVATPQEMALANLFRQQMAGPEDEEMKRLRDREDAIYARIMRGPRERAKELTAELWKERYGITEKSGKLARIFAGIGEIGRAGGGGSKYVSIPDQARHLAEKEYQTEVGPLQREASVLSSAQKAAKAQADLTRYRNEQLAKDWYIQQRKLGQTDEQIAMRSGLTKAQIEKLKADAGYTEARTGLVNEQTDAAQQGNAVRRQFGGAMPTGPLANAFALNSMGEEDPNRARNVLGTFDLLGGNKAKGAAGPKRTVQVPYEKLVVGYDQEGKAHASRVPDVKIYREAAPGGADTSLRNAPPGWFKPDQQYAEASRVSPKGVSPQQITPSPGGKFNLEDPVDGSSRQTQPRAGNFASQRVDPTHIDNLSRRFGIAPEKFKNFRSSRFTDWVGPAVKEPTERAMAKKSYYENLSNLTRLSANAFASGNDGDISGLFENFENNIKAMVGDLGPEAIAIRQSAIDTIATKILEMSGKAVTNQERAMYMKSLPNITSDAPSTFVAKAMVLKHLLDTRKMFSEARLGDDEIDRLYATRSGQILAGMAGVQFRKLEEFRNATANGKPITVGGVQYTDMSKAAAAIKNGMNRDTINKYFKQALKEAGINDAIPLD